MADPTRIAACFAVAECDLCCRGSDAESAQGTITMMFRLLAAASAFAWLIASHAQAQQPVAPSVATATTAAGGPPAYGPPLTFDMAKRIMAAAEAEAQKNNLPLVIAIIDSGGHMVMLHRLDNSQLASLRLAQGKARTALEFRRPTKALEEAIAGGGAGLRLLAIDDVTPVDGGHLIMVDGKIAGALGVSGAPAGQDAQVAKAGLDAIGK
jgi:glc operon protein GlcG